MRPAGEIRQAMLKAAQEAYAELLERMRKEPEPADKMPRGVTLQEIAHRAQVGSKEARECIANCKRAGVLSIVGQRRVPYRNRPVAEYAPPMAAQLFDSAPNGAAVLGSTLQAWAR